MTARNRYHHGNLRAALIDAALDLLRTAGLEGLSLRAVARGAGVSQTAPYSHFSDKRALLAAVAETGFQQLVSAMRAEAASCTRAETRLARLGKGYVRFALKEPALFRLMFGSELGDIGDFPALGKVAGQAYDQLRQSVSTLMEGAPAAQHNAECVAAWSLVHGLAVLLMDGRIAQPAETREQLIEDTTAAFAARLAALASSPIRGR
ncbi:TetR/AcrR family transcriptional regulator [Alkalilimnicola sp. S0819]|uniref:TetR/AcrR family transcriptional regulator n=1 Tax=Alkalilimnicola sp. S0819 TaxID=2613922 RepID=UPI001261E192|nr:TetR/AcrR family transcriptional regulator [Alkalilimnicola sp. S0819]KAB7622661.1 TetR/AcrR family transcriptional regulator [Alkalilimnicola sp. S0819]MPQ17432.1 TetR family transcriptional regulator [Alkalilimnicola sp. S0819]